VQAYTDSELSHIIKTAEEEQMRFKPELNERGKMKTDRKFKIVLLAAALIFTFTTVIQAEDYKTPAQFLSEAKAAVKHVTVQELKQMMDKKEKIILLDIRDRDEYEKKHIPGSIHMSRGDLEFHVNEIISDKNAKIVVI
jgi:hypothetical protein